MRHGFPGQIPQKPKKLLHARGMQQNGTRNIIGLRHRRLLNVKGQHPARIPRQAAQQGRIPALSRRGVDAEVSRLHGPAQEFVDHRQCVQLHRSVPPYRKGTLIEGPFDGSNIA